MNIVYFIKWTIKFYNFNANYFLEIYIFREMVKRSHKVKLYMILDKIIIGYFVIYE